MPQWTTIFEHNGITYEIRGLEWCRAEPDTNTPARWDWYKVDVKDEQGIPRPFYDDDGILAKALLDYHPNPTQVLDD